MNSRSSRGDNRKGHGLRGFIVLRDLGICNEVPSIIVYIRPSEKSFNRRGLGLQRDHWKFAQDYYQPGLRRAGCSRQILPTAYGLEDNLADPEGLPKKKDEDLQLGGNSLHVSSLPNFSAISHSSPRSIPISIPLDP